MRNLPRGYTSQSLEGRGTYLPSLASPRCGGAPVPDNLPMEKLWAIRTTYTLLAIHLRLLPLTSPRQQWLPVPAKQNHHAARSHEYLATHTL